MISSYANLTDFQRILSKSEANDISDLDDADRSSVQIGRIEGALIAASRDIDSVLARLNYLLPLTIGIYDQLVDICVFLAWEKLNVFGERPEVVRLADNARERLEYIRLIDPVSGKEIIRQDESGCGDAAIYNGRTIIADRSVGVYVPNF